MCAVQTFRLAHFIKSEEVENHIRILRRLDGFGEKHRIHFSVSLIAVAHRFDFQISLPSDQLLDRLHFRGIDHGGACSLVPGLESEIADYCDFGPRLKRKDLIIVFEKDRALRRCFSRQRMVSFDIKLLAVALSSLCGSQYRVQQLVHAGVQIFHGKGSVLDCLHQFPRGAESGSGHFQIRTGLDCRHVIIRSAPVGDHKSVVIPVTAKDFLKQMHTLVGILAVDLVVGSHDRAWFRLINCHFKSGQIDLAQGALINDRVHRHAALLLGVDRKVLDTGIYSLALDALHVGSGHPARQIRVFREILEVSSAQRTSLDVHTGAEQNIDAHRLGLFAQRDADLCSEVLIPAARHCCGCRETGCRKGCVETKVISRSRLAPEPVRAVRHDHRRDVQPGNISGVPLSLASEQGCLFLQRQLIN